METINCFICELPFDVNHEDIVHVKKRGCRNLKKVSERRGDGKFCFLDLEVDTVAVTVHNLCWLNYTNEKSVQVAERRIRKSLNLSTKNDVLIKIEGVSRGGKPGSINALLQVERTNSDFEYATLCLFCGEDASEKFSFQQRIKPAHERKQVKVVTKGSLGKIMLLATVWGEDIVERVKDKDLESLNARFHYPCYTQYFSAIPNNESLTNAKNAVQFKKFQNNLKKELLGEDCVKMETSKDEKNEEFDYKTHCIICAKDASEDFISKQNKKPEKNRIKVYSIQRSETVKTLLQWSYKSNEKFREEFRSRVNDQDLVALKARYHRNCYKHFNYVKKGTPKGRPRAVNSQFKIEIEDTQPACWDEYYQDYIVNEDVEFNFQTQCIICGRNVSKSAQEEAGNSIRVIQRHDTGENLLYASFRFIDKWREQVRDRVKDKDLVALRARYHKSCFPQFFVPPPKTKKQIVCIADSNETDYLRVDQEEQNALSDVFDDISLDNEHDDSYCDMSLLENDESVEERENSEHHYQNNSFVCREDNSEQFLKKQTELQPEKEITAANVMKNQSTEISIKKSTLRNKQKLQGSRILLNDEIKIVNSECSASDVPTDLKKYCHEKVEQQNTTDGETVSPETVWDCGDIIEDHEETQDNRNFTEGKAIYSDNFHTDEVQVAERRIRKSLNLSTKNDVLIKIEGVSRGGKPGSINALLQVERTNSDFEYATLCLFCGEDASEKFSFQQRIKPAHERKQVKVVTKGSLGKIMLLATVWGEDIVERVKDKDLESLNARFHYPCYTQYFSAIPNNESLTNAKNAVPFKKFQNNLKKELLGEDCVKMETSKDEKNEEFDYKTHCIICAKDASEDFISKQNKKPEKNRIKVYSIQRSETVKTLLQWSYKSNEKFREEFRSRVNDQDLVALKARYHRNCYKHFNYVKKGTPKGRPRAVNSQFKIEIEDTQPACWDEYYQDYIVNEDVEFNFQTQCIICGRNVSKSAQEEAGNSIRVIQRHDTGENLLYASFRFIDKWREQVRDRVKDKDLVALRARYHKSCFPQFFVPPPKTKKQIVCIADSNETDYLRVDQEEQNALSDVFDDISLDNEHDDSYCDMSLLENDESVEERENSEHHYQNNSFVCREDNSEQFLKKQTELQPEKEITAANVMKNQSTEISIKKSTLRNKQKLQGSRIFLNDEIKIVNSECSASDIPTDLKKYCHEKVEQQNTTDGETVSPETVWDCGDIIEDHEETQDNRNFTEGEAIYSDNFHTDEEYCGNVYKNKLKNTNRKTAKKRKEVSWCSQMCNTCLTPGRKLYRLVRYAQIFNTIIGNKDTITVYVCGECLDDLRKIHLFIEKTRKSQQILNEIRQFKEAKKGDDVPTVTEQTCTSNKSNNDVKKSSDEDFSDCINDSQVNDDETDLENNSYPTTSCVEQTCAMTSNVTAIKRNVPIKQNRAEEQSDFKLSADDASDSDIEPPTKKHKTRETDSDYVPSYVKKETKPPKKTEKHKRAQCKITYTGINLKGVVKKVKIDPEDAKTWIEKERNSVYFRNLQNKCVLCVSRLRPHESLKRHLALFHNNSLANHVCPVCEIVFKTTENLNDHLEKHFFLLRCDVCGYKCYGKHNMQDHLSRHRKSIECLECGTLFGYASEFHAHYQEHFKCNECGKNMFTKEKLKIHVERHHAIHKCNECDKTFSKYVKLQKHKSYKHKIQRNEESYCVSCDKQFANTHVFKRHILTSDAHAHERTESQKVTCPECNRVLSSKYRLKEHYICFHSQEKRPTFPCPTCGKQFASRNHVKIHIKRVHDRVEVPRNKICQYCGRAFKTKRILIHHIRTHTGEKPHQCPFCDAAFAQKTPMQTHIQKRHKNEQSSILTHPTGTAGLEPIPKFTGQGSTEE